MARLIPDSRGTAFNWDKSGQAVAKLKQVLTPMDMTPRLEVAEVDNSTFLSSPVEPNRIWIPGQPIEDWLNAMMGGSRCC